ncbi:MAG TPA: hypothetical protein PKA41_19010 [Verrucomicrobiota bacterium]|nr:hypothetical protein [Verrucomicrobiota bacterium]
MSTQAGSSKISAKGLWGLLWRSVVFAPFVVVLTTLYLTFLAAVLALPLLAILHTYLREWNVVLLCIAMWLPLLPLTRWKRLHIDPKDDLNGQDNI